MSIQTHDVIDLREGLPYRRPTLRKFSISLVIPALNEADGLRWVLPRLPVFIDELIIVDGGSTDDTLEVISTLAPEAIALGQTGRGKGNAIKAGLQRATGDIVVTMDADGSMDPADIAPAVEALLAGHDFVKGSRELPGAGSADFTVTHRIGNQVLTAVCNGIFGRRYTDITYGFNAYWRNVMVDADELSDGFEFEIQAAVRAARSGLRTAEVPCFEAQRIGGASKLHALRDGYRILRVIVREAHPRRPTNFRAVVDLHLEPMPLALVDVSA